MKNNQSNKGFTLIELLVVVLIIGILSAVALPQYQKAVEKARSVEALTLLKSLGQAIQVYKLGHRGNNPTSFSDLDIEIPSTGESISSPSAIVYGTVLDSLVINNNWGAIMMAEHTFLIRLDGSYARKSGFAVKNGVIGCCRSDTSADLCKLFPHESTIMITTGAMFCYALK